MATGMPSSTQAVSFMTWMVSTSSITRMPARICWMTKSFSWARLARSDPALAGELFALGRTRAESVGEQREGEERDAEQAGLGVGGLREGAGDVRVDALCQHGQRGDGGEQQCGATDQAEAAQGDGYRDQHAQPGLDAAAGMHHHGDQDDIDEYRQLGLVFLVTDLAQVHDQGDDGRPR